MWTDEQHDETEASVGVVDPRDHAIMEIVEARQSVAMQGGCPMEVGRLSGLIDDVVRGRCDPDSAVKEAKKIAYQVKRFA